MEAGVAVVIALFTGLGAVTTRLHKRIDDLDTRVDKHELRVAESYISKTDFASAIDRVEKHMIRIENKLGQTGGMTSVIQWVITHTLSRRKTRKMVINVLEKLAKRTDNQLDDQLVQQLKRAIL